MNQREDSRYERTEQDLRDAFRILAGKKELDKISVSEITKLTGITRSTFYNHYEDMPTFISAMETVILEEIFQMLREFEPNNSLQVSRTFFSFLCHYMKENPFLMRILVTPHANLFVEKALSMLHRYSSEKAEHARKTGEEQQAFLYALAYSIGGVVGVLHKWGAGGCKDSPETVAAYLTTLFSERDFV